MAEAKHDNPMIVPGVMHSMSRVVANSSFAPVASAEWEVRVDPVGITDPIAAQKYILTYNNLMYDLVAAVLAKLGVEYSKLINGEYDNASFDKEMKATLESLNAGTAAE